MAVTIRKNDIRAAVLYFLSFAIHILAIFIYQPAVISGQLLFWGPLVFTLAVYFALSAGVWAGYRWVKILIVMVVAWQVAMYLPGISGTNNPRGAIALEILAIALEVWAAIIVLKDLLTRPLPALAQSEHFAAETDTAARQL
jgi:hypothetical protein